ncbi:MAG TPA: LuxR family transcriptional regulator [Sphingomonas sp.]|nr:LuxR family transcriptional regulator [Sphingomonas sp.]
MRRGIIPGIIKRSTVAQGATPPVDLLRAAITHSSIAIAVCDHDFTMRFFNPAIGRLIDRASTLAGDTPAVLHGAAVLGLLGVDDVAAAMADIAAHGAWRGVARAQHVAVEPFGDAGSTAGWLITARECAGPAAPARSTERDLIARSDKLSAREREVMLALQEGASNKVIALRLGISPRTVEFHRARIMKRFDARSLVDLVRKVAAEVRGAE